MAGITGITQAKTVNIKNIPVAALKEDIQHYMQQIGGVNVPETPFMAKLTIEGTIRNNEGKDEIVNQTIHLMPKYQDRRFAKKFKKKNDIQEGETLANDAVSTFRKDIQQQLGKLRQDLAQWQTQTAPQPVQIMKKNAPDSIENRQKRGITIDESKNTLHVWEVKDDKEGVEGAERNQEKDIAKN